MQDPVAKAKFNSSRQNLSNSLKKLELLVKDKIENNFNDNASLNLQRDHDLAELEIHQQKLQITDLTTEINNLNLALNQVAKENELLHSRSNGLAEMRAKLNKQANDIIIEVNNKLQKIEEIISKL
jgi:chromosome segregation ATPase